ncbi:HalOD1 output domain-containing protein [Natrialbaceae archaeon GCM10025810]|uniref:HalOD1 output domain-containing protein n=1 Tax=Halovalidus salilacus TaxID=3075124 RepID=UPI003616E551
MHGGTRADDGYEPHSVTIRFQDSYDWSATPPSIATADALATVTGIAPAELSLELETCLYDHVNPDALDALVREQKTERVVVSFTFGHYRIWFEGEKLTVRSINR